MLSTLRQSKVLIFGTFDHLHPGHHFVLNEALKRGAVTVVVGRDENVRRIKDHAPEQCEQERLAAIAAAFPDVTPILGDPQNFLIPVTTVKPDLILLGYDQKLPPGVREFDLPCPIERLTAYRENEFKSSLRKRS